MQPDDWLGGGVGDVEGALVGVVLVLSIQVDAAGDFEPFACVADQLFFAVFFVYGVDLPRVPRSVPLALFGPVVLLVAKKAYLTLSWAFLLPMFSATVPAFKGF